MRYVYILLSLSNEYHFYTGMTEDVQARLQKHNAGGVPHTAKYKPWRIKAYACFTEDAQAAAFEDYLRSASGRAFAKKRL